MYEKKNEKKITSRKLNYLSDWIIATISSVKYVQTRGWRVCTRFHRMCSNKINAICWACKFYGRTGRIERWRGNGVCIKEGGRPWTGKWRPVKWTAWKGALLSRLLAFGFLLFNERFLSRSTPRQRPAFHRRDAGRYVKRESMLLSLRGLKYIPWRMWNILWIRVE